MENPPEVFHPPQKKKKNKKKRSSEQVFLNHFRWVPDSCHGKEGKSSHKVIEKVRVNAVFFDVSGWVLGPL